MNAESASLKESQFVLRRFFEPLDTKGLFVPGILLFAIMVLILAFRHRDELKLLSDAVAWYVKLVLAAVVALVILIGFVPGILAGDGVMIVDWALFSFFGLLVFFLLTFAVGLLLVMARGHHRELTVVGALAAVLLIVSGGYVYFSYQLSGVPFAWLLVMVPLLVIAAFYIGAMYYYDSRSVHPLWASFLGLLRMTVYAMLAVCFLLPGCQEYETTLTESKILVLFDVSGSTEAVDGQEGEGGITRQEKIIRFLTTAYQPHGSSSKTFLDHLTDNTPVACYRFGAGADDEPILFDGKLKKSWQPQEWRTWFRPDKVDRAEIRIPANITDEQQRAAYIQSKLALYAHLRDGTDVGGSALQVLQREGNSRIQAIIIFSDGNSNRGDEEAIRQLLERAANPKRQIHVITVGVGDYKQPVRIRINPLIAPQAVRADDGAFEVRVPVFGDGLAGEDFEVTLLAQRVKDRNGVELKKEPVYTVGKAARGKFGGGGEFPYDEVVFKVNLEQITKIRVEDDAKGQLQGQWNFTAQLPRHAREAPDKDKPLHVSQPKAVMVNDSTLRVLLFASGPSRDYQFVRTLMAREVDAKRAKLSVYLQTAKGLDDVSQDVDGSHLLNDFPTKLERPTGGKKDDASKEGDPMNLKSYDVIIAFDPDWGQLSAKQKDLLKEWVEGEHGGGIVFVAGPQHTLRLIPPVNEDLLKKWDLKQVYSLFPVVMARPPAGVKADSLHDTTIPYPLDFTGIAKGVDFLKLDDESPLPLGGWSEFFGKVVGEEFPGAGIKYHPERGFHNYFRISKVKDGAEVLATFGDAKAPKTIDNKEQPYFVSLRVGKGKTFYIGSGEMWRLRAFKEEYHQRFWIKLARYISSGSGAKSFGRFSMAGEYVTGIIPIEAEVRDKDSFPLNPETPPVVTIRKLDGGDSKDAKLPTTQLKAKSGQAKRGVFVGSVRLDKEGFYEAKIDIQGTEESITQTFEVKSPNVEMSDLRTNFPKLYNMATDATPGMLQRLDRESRERLEGAKDRPKGGPDDKVDTASGARLFFRLANAQPISQCITKVRPEEEKVKGAIRDLWDQGPEVYNAASWEDAPGLFWAMLVVPMAIMTTVIVLMLIGGRWIAAIGVAAALGAIEAGMLSLIAFATPEEIFQPSAFGVLLVVPPLICLVAAGILLIAERYYWVLSVLGLMVVYLGALLLAQAVLEPDWPAMKVDFTWMLLLIALLLSVEWFTRKMLRLA